MPPPVPSIQQRQEQRHLSPMLLVQLPGHHTASLHSPETYYLTIPLPKTAPLKDVLERFLASNMTDDYDARHPSFYYETFAPVPYLRSNLRNQKYPPRGFATAPRNMAECSEMARELMIQGQILISALGDFRMNRIEKHLGPFVDNSECASETTRVFRATLPPATTDGTRAANQALVDDHEVVRRKSLRRLYDTCDESCDILTTIGMRFQDIKTYARRSIAHGHSNVMPPRLAQVFIEVSIWHYKVEGAMTGMHADWEEARMTHVEH